MHPLLGVVLRPGKRTGTRLAVPVIPAVRVIAEDIKLSHSVFALPFAVLAASMAASSTICSTQKAATLASVPDAKTVSETWSA